MLCVDQVDSGVAGDDTDGQCRAACASNPAGCVGVSDDGVIMVPFDHLDAFEADRDPTGGWCDVERDAQQVALSEHGGSGFDDGVVAPYGFKGDVGLVGCLPEGNSCHDVILSRRRIVMAP